MTIKPQHQHALLIFQNLQNKSMEKSTIISKVFYSNPKFYIGKLWDGINWVLLKLYHVYHLLVKKQKTTFWKGIFGGKFEMA